MSCQVWYLDTSCANKNSELKFAAVVHRKTLDELATCSLHTLQSFLHTKHLLSEHAIKQSTVLPFYTDCFIVHIINFSCQYTLSVPIRTASFNEI